MEKGSRVEIRTVPITVTNKPASEEGD